MNRTLAGFIIFIDIILGIWWGAMYSVLFWWMNQGYVVGEPDVTVRRVELILAVLLTVWFIVQIPYWVKTFKRLRFGAR